MPSYSAYYPDLVKILIYQHCHSDAPENRLLVQKRLTNGLDFDQAETVIDKASSDLPFVCTQQQHIWYIQNRDMLIYVRDKTDLDLQLLSDKFDHLKPPGLEQEFNL